LAKNSRFEKSGLFGLQQTGGYHNAQSPRSRKSIKDIFKFSENVFPVGRLDKDSCGLIILTNDGRITDKLLNPDYDHEKEYEVKVDRSVTPSFLEHMSGPMILGDGYRTKKCQVEKKIISLFLSF